MKNTTQKNEKMSSKGAREG